jgi:hypothetical protein
MQTSTATEAFFDELSDAAARLEEMRDRYNDDVKSVLNNIAREVRRLKSLRCTRASLERRLPSWPWVRPAVDAESLGTARIRSFPPRRMTANRTTAPRLPNDG